MNSSQKNKKEFLKLLSKAVVPPVDNNFKKRLEKRLSSQAPSFLQTEKKQLPLFFFFITMYKKALAGAFIVVILIGVIASFKLFSSDTPLTPQLVIDRAYAVYQRELSNDGSHGIFYQKALYEVDGDDFSIPAKKFIEESWEDTVSVSGGNYLLIQRDTKTEDILSVMLQRSKDANSPYIYENVDNFLLLERLSKEEEKQKMNVNNMKKEGLDPRFTILEYQQQLIPKISSDPEFSQEFRKFMSHGFLRFENFLNTPQSVNFDVVLKYLTSEKSKPILHISVDTSTAQFQVTNLQGEKITPHDYSKIVAQLYDELDRSPIADEVRKQWKLRDEKYYCVNVFEDKRNRYQTLLEISKTDPSSYTISGSSVLKDFSKISPLDEVKTADEQLYDVKHLKLTPDRIRTILDNLKTDQGILYKQEDINGIRYHVFSPKASLDAPYQETYYFDQDYTFAREKIHVSDSFGERTITITYLDRKDLDSQQGQELFDLRSAVLSHIPLIPQFEEGVNASSFEHFTETGCYEFDGTRLSTEKEKLLWGSLPPQALKEFNMMKEHMMEPAPPLISPDDRPNEVSIDSVSL